MRTRSTVGVGVYSGAAHEVDVGRSMTDSLHDGSRPSTTRSERPVDTNTTRAKSEKQSSVMVRAAGIHGYMVGLPTD